jgi:hypothetical protein
MYERVVRKYVRGVITNILVRNSGACWMTQGENPLVGFDTYSLEY